MPSLLKKHCLCRKTFGNSLTSSTDLTKHTKESLICVSLTANLLELLIHVLQSYVLAHLFTNILVCLLFFIHEQNDMDEMTYIHTFQSQLRLLLKSVHPSFLLYRVISLHRERVSNLQSSRGDCPPSGLLPTHQSNVWAPGLPNTCSVIADISALTNIQKASSFRYTLFLFSFLHKKALLNFNCSLLLPRILQRVYIAKLFSLTQFVYSN